MQPSVTFLYPLTKTFRFSDVFRRYRKAPPGCNGLINRLRLGFSHLWEHKFRVLPILPTHNAYTIHSWNWKYRAFLSTLPKQLICSHNLMNELNNISTAISSLNLIDFIRQILYGDKNFNVTNFKKSSFKLIIC